MPTPDAYHSLVGGPAGGPLAHLARAGLALASLPYRVGVAARNLAYQQRWRTSHRAPCPVISIGNITLGGTGKTPAVEWVARWLRARGVRVALLSRGYKSQQGMNDEGLVLDQNLPDVPHLQDPDRARLAAIAVDELESQVLVLDDGFQHRRLARDLDIVLLDALCPFGHGRLFPRGLLREPISALRRAHVVVLSRADFIPASERAGIRARAERAAGPLVWAEARHAPRDLIDHAGSAESLSALTGKRVAAFCGIGNPAGYRRTLETLSVAACGFKTFADHHAYTRADVDQLGQWLAGCGADLALTTQKDLVKLRMPNLGGVPLRALRIGLAFLEGQPGVEAALERTIAPLAAEL